MKNIKYLAALAVIIVLLFPIQTKATHGFGAGLLTIYVDGVPFEVWAYGGGGGDGIAHIRMRDMAYMLNGTPAQFDIRAAEDGRFDYWIVRDEPYTATGAELQPIPGDRYVMFGSYGHFEWHGFDNYPIQTAILGIDGAIVPVPVMQDIDDMYFSLPTLANFFGVHLSEYTISTESPNPAEFPDRSLELVDLMVRLAGQWIDREYYYSPVINEHVVNPMEIALSVHGFSDNASRLVNAAALSWSWVPADWYAVSIQNIGDGLVELIINESFEGYRIVVDASERQIDEITLYIGDTAYQMVRYYWQRMVRHYHAEASECGGIVLRYVIRTGAFPLEFQSGDVAVYRSTVQGEQGERILMQENVTFSDSILYEFTDATAEFGQVYYYSLVRVTDWGTTSLAPAPDIWLYQMRVDTAEIMQEPVEMPNEPKDVADSPTRSPARIYVISLLLLIASIIAINGKRLFVKTLVLLVIFACLPIAASATVDGVWSGQYTIEVDGKVYEPWGYRTDMDILYLCLFDMAHMLNGTSAQFGIRPATDNRWDIWIVRGERHTVAGINTEPIPWRGTARADGGGLFGWNWEDSGFDYYPEQTLIVGIDGVDEPATFIAIRTIQDIDGTYFDIRDLAPLLGFEALILHGHAGDPEGYLRGFDAVFSTGQQPVQLPIQTPEFVDILRRINGQWVDRAHFHSPTIDESIVWPAELTFSYHGLNIPVVQSVSPIHPGWASDLLEWDLMWWYPVAMRTLENGLVELTVTRPEQAQVAWNATATHDQAAFLSLSPRFCSYRIVVDPNKNWIDELTLYIDDTPHTMIRYRLGWYPQYIAARYHVQPTDDGGIMLRYILDRWALWNHDDIVFRISRNDVLLFSQVGIAAGDRIIFEFIDDTVELGEVYYYSLWCGRNNNITPMAGSIRVDVNEVLGVLPEPEVEPETIAEPEVETINRTRVLFLLILIAIAAVWFTWFIYRLTLPVGKRVP